MSSLIHTEETVLSDDGTLRYSRKDDGPMFFNRRLRILVVLPC